MERLPKRPSIRVSPWCDPEVRGVLSDGSLTGLTSANLILDRVWFGSSDRRVNESDHPNRRDTTEPEDSDGNCTHSSCGYGDNVVSIVTLTSPLLARPCYAFVRWWSGCLSYNLDDADSDMTCSDSIEDLVETCLDPITQTLVRECLDNPNNPARRIRDWIRLHIEPAPLATIVLEFICLLPRKL